MSSSDDPIPNESSSTWYLHHLDTHIQQSKRQILGQRSILVPNKRNPFPTVVPPSNTVWTPEEKELFFASLSRHSRYRVDLIASELKTKNQDEIEWYLDLLELGSEIVGQVDRKRRDAGLERLRWDGVRSWRKGLSPSAREVSDSWINKEEVLAEKVIKEREERDNEERDALMKKERRAQKKQLIDEISPVEEWKKDIELTPYLRNKLIENHPAYKKMINQWEVDDYLMKMDGEKLTVVNNLMKPDWSTWYSDRVKMVSTSTSTLSPNKKMVSPEDEADEDDGEEEEEEGSEMIGGIPTKGDPRGKITIDQQNYNEIINIPKKERTPEQRKLLSKIINRRRNREKYRIQKLIEEGLTRDEIDLAGGADAIFQSREPVTQTDSDQAPKIPQKRITKRNDTNVQTAHLRRIGTYDHLMMSGLEVFNYEMIERVNRRLNLTDPRGMSFSALQGIHSLLVNQLRRLIYSSILIAEQSYLQHPSDDHDGPLPQISPEHVHQALLKEGLVHPSELILEFIERLFDNEPNDNQDEQDIEVAEGDNQDKEEEEVGVRIGRYHAAILPPGEIQWNDIPYISTHSNEEEEEDRQGMYDDISDAATEIEDKELDEALYKMDEAHDKQYEKSLWVAVDDGNDDVDRSEIWTKDRKNETKSEKEYINLLLSTDSARRKRKHKENIHQRYPTTRIKKLARANKRMKSNAWIIDSDSDSSEDEGNGYVWDPNEGDVGDDDDEVTDTDQEDGSSEDDELDGEDEGDAGAEGEGLAHEEEDELRVYEDEEGDEHEDEEEDGYQDEKGEE
ncbi:uncharacterized protein L199_002294 [Kwoniella botswanensis]|uniref:uncharacterized protein n=1 Tax=Kwoniella botswanensis TaxID=1268659 RepID=UPI00315CEF1B